jgi:tRNA N6-adenosine threonylcarbamoyltransferase
MSKKNEIILAIESSCDETAAAVVAGNIRGSKPEFRILSSVIKSQIAIHQKTGGVVPEVAARAHIQNILPVTRKALNDAGVKLADLNYIAVTSGPGLVVSLIVGVEFAKGLSLATGLPLVPTNHMAGHLYSAFTAAPEKVNFPVLSIVVSGGHTMLILMEDYHHFRVIGETVDDAAGEAFDKVARLLTTEGQYRGGPQVSKLAKRGKTDLKFTRPMLHADNFKFSFSGLKTAVLYYMDKLVKPISPQQKADIAMSFERAVADVLVTKAMRAAKNYGCKTVSLSGGVAANTHLRKTLAVACREAKLALNIPPFELCTDNAQMIAIAAYFKLRGGSQPVSPARVKANPHWELRPS